jgi:hypothetical protein
MLQGRFDELVEQAGVKVLIDPAALMHVLGTRMDFVEDRLRWAACVLAFKCGWLVSGCWGRDRCGLVIGDWLVVVAPSYGWVRQPG